MLVGNHVVFVFWVDGLVVWGYVDFFEREWGACEVLVNKSVIEVVMPRVVCKVKCVEECGCAGAYFEEVGHTRLV